MKKAITVWSLMLAASLTSCGYPPTSPKGAADEVAALNQATPVQEEASTVGRPEVFRGAFDIRAALESFRTTLGTLNPNQAGSFGSGRREINWDAVPALFTNTDDFPRDFFNQPATGRARGAVFATPGTGFRVSDSDLADVNGTYADEFQSFSPVRTFVSVGDPLSSVDFFVPGTSTPATTRGFGVVFSDVDHPGSARLRLFDAAGHNLGTYLAPASPGGLSFVGVAFPDPIVARVEILSGQAALGPDSFDRTSGSHGPARDLVIMDDFIYGEPIAPSGASAALGANGEAARSQRRSVPGAGSERDRAHGSRAEAGM